MSLWLKYYYPDVFTAAILNSQPMGFYAPAQIVTDAKNHNVEVREIDSNFSQWDHTLEERKGDKSPLRLGFRLIKGLNEDDMMVLIAGRSKPYEHLSEIYNAGVPQSALERLANADAFRSLNLDRRQALWQVAALADTSQGLFKNHPSASITEKQITLPFMSQAEHVIQDYASTALSLKAHPIQFTRPELTRLGISSCKDIYHIQAGSQVKAAGIVLSRQRPGTAGGICFMTLEDETGTVNVVIFEKLFDTYRKEILGAKLLMVNGWVQREGQVLHVVVKSCHDLTRILTYSTKVEECYDLKEAPPLPFNVQNKRTQVRESSAGEIIPKARNFR